MWEYHTEIVKEGKSWLGGKFDGDILNSKLNEMGREGWELINFMTSNVGFGNSGYLIMIFKREI